MKYVVPTFLSLLFVAPAFTQSILNLSQTPEEVLAKSIKYHDPAGEWGKFPIQLHLTETRPNGPDRKTTLTIDIPNETFAIDQLRDGHQLYSEINQGVCSFKLDGNSEISEAELEKYRLNCDRTKTLRDYYTYSMGAAHETQRSWRYFTRKDRTCRLCRNRALHASHNLQPGSRKRYLGFLS
jgi:hypothetical protein